MSWGIKLVDNGANLNSTQLNNLQGELDKLYKQSGYHLTQADFQNFLTANNVSNPNKFSFQEIPNLAKPSLDYYIDALGTGGLTPSAAIMAVITKDAAEQRKINKELIHKKTEEMVKNIEDQAKTMKDKAKMQLVTGIISGAVTVGGGLTCLGAGWYGTSHGTATELVTARMQAGGSTAQGLSGIVGGIGQSLATSYDAELKLKEANLERVRADRDVLKEFNNSWNDLIQKTLATSDAMQQNRTQALSRILG